MVKGYYPATYEVYVETFYPPFPGGRGYSLKTVKATGLGEAEAKELQAELRKTHTVSGEFAEHVIIREQVAQ